MTEAGCGSTASKTKYIYDGFDRLVRVADTNSKTVTYGYDATGDLTCLSYPGATTTDNCQHAGSGTEVVTYAYDHANRLALGLGSLGGFAAAACGLSVGTLCATALGASAFNGLVGGILGDVAYQSDDCQPTLAGYASAFLAGLLQSEPVPIPESWLP